MEADRIKWNERFASQDSYLGNNPSPFLAREIERIKTLVSGFSALDIACGEGRNSLFLARHGFNVVGLDISDVGLAKGRCKAQTMGAQIDYRLVDLDDYIWKEKFDVILNFNFLLRDLIPHEVASLNPGGVLLFDTIMASGQPKQSSNPDFLLRPGELSKLFASYDGDILYSEERPSGDMPTAGLLFRKNPECR